MLKDDKYSNALN
jgi:hypothetical protein